MIQELDCVALTEDLPTRGLKKGSIGTAVMVYNKGEAYEVEFMTSNGETIALITLLPSQIRPIDEEQRTQA